MGVVVDKPAAKSHSLVDSQADFSLSLYFTAKMWELLINLLLYIIPSTYQYSLVVNAGEEVFTIDGQVYSSSSSLDCLQGVRCSSPEQEWTTCLVLDQESDGENNGESDDEEGAEEDKCASLDWEAIHKKVASARKNLSLDVRQVEEKVKKVEKDVEKINTNLKRKVDSINTKIDDLLKRLKYL